MKQSGRAILAERLAAWLREQGPRSSARALSIRAGLAENAVSRILEKPERETQRSTWEKLAACLGWDVEDVLGLAGYGQAAEPAGESPDLLLERAMALWNLDEEARTHMRRQVQLLRRIPPAPTPEPSPPRGGLHPNAGRTPRNTRARWRDVVTC